MWWVSSQRSEHRYLPHNRNFHENKGIVWRSQKSSNSGVWMTENQGFIIILKQIQHSENKDKLQECLL
jgi:hypothetical protein